LSRQEKNRINDHANVSEQLSKPTRNVIAFSTKNLFNHSKPVYSKSLLNRHSQPQETENSLYSIYFDESNLNKEKSEHKRLLTNYYDIDDKYLNQEQQYIEYRRNFYANQQEQKETEQQEQHQLFSSSSSFSFNGIGGDEDYDRIIGKVAQMYNNQINCLNSNNEDFILDYY
jgi:hypothetical protein